MSLTLSIFPDLKGISYPVLKSPQWSTEVHRSTAGKRTTYGRFVYPFYKYELPYEFLRSGTMMPGMPANEYQELLAFYNSQHGMEGLWLFNDKSDNTATTMAFGPATGTVSVSQLTRTIFGSVSQWTDPVFAPTVTNIKNGSVTLSLGVDYTMTDTGAVTLTPPLVAPALNWTGTYMWLSRFDEDGSDFEQFMQYIWSNSKIPFSTEKL